MTFLAADPSMCCLGASLQPEPTKCECEYEYTIRAFVCHTVKAKLALCFYNRGHHWLGV
jgi:hypothetical protein